MRQIFQLFRMRNLLWLSIVAVAAYGLYFVKFQVLEVQRQIASVEKELHKEYQHVHVVEAEWAYLTRPDRLQQLVRQHTTLKPVIGLQVQQVAALPFPTIDDAENSSSIVAVRYGGE